MSINWQPNVVNEDNPDDEVILTGNITLQDLVTELQQLCEQGHKDKKVSICGCTEFYIHLFDKDSRYVTFDTDSDI